MAKNSEGNIESSTLPVLILTFNYRTYQDDIYTPYEGQEFEYASIENTLEFGFFPFADLSGEYNYRIALATDSNQFGENGNAVEYSATDNSWNNISSTDDPLISVFSSLSPVNSAFEFTSNSTVYWAVRADNGITQKQSDIRSFKIIP